MSKTLNKKQFFIFLFAFVALLSLAGGLTFYFLANKPIKQVPQSVALQKVDGEYCLIAEHQNKYGYQFKLEQQIDEQYLLIANLDSKTNILNLQENNITLLPGKQYRFSVCFKSEAKEGKFSTPTEAIIQSTLKAVDYASIKIENDVLSWDKVDFADKYLVKLLSNSGETIEKTVTQTSLSLADFEGGRYTIYLSSASDDAYYLSSAFGQGKEFEIVRENEILSAELTEDKVLSIITTQKVEKFELYKDNKLLATFSAKEISKLNYQIDLTVLLKDGDATKLQIKALASDYILESELKDIT